MPDQNTQFAFETQCINQLARDRFGLTVSARASTSMRALVLSLVEVRNLLATGEVIRSGMLDRRGRWIVEGKIEDFTRMMRVDLAISISDNIVELLDVQQR